MSGAVEQSDPASVKAGAPGASSKERNATSLQDQAERDRRRKTRSIAIALALGFLVMLFYAATIVRLGGNVVNRPLTLSPFVILGSFSR